MSDPREREDIPPIVSDTQGVGLLETIVILLYIWLMKKRVSCGKDVEIRVSQDETDRGERIAFTCHNSVGWSRVEFGNGSDVRRWKQDDIRLTGIKWAKKETERSRWSFPHCFLQLTKLSRRGCVRCEIPWLSCKLVDQACSGTCYYYIDFLCIMKSWDLSDLDLDVPSDAVESSPSGVASAVASTGTSPALFSTPATTATGSTGGCLQV